jgi:phasin family protein
MATQSKEQADARTAGQTAGDKAAEAARKLNEAGQFAADQFTKRISEMNFPGMPDLDAVTTANRRNMEALSAANRTALEGAQTVARRYSEIMQQAMTQMGEAVKALASTEAPEQKAAKQMELLKAAYQQAVANMKELSELIQKSNAEAVGLLNARFSEGMDEVKGLIEKFGEKAGG